MFIEKICRTCLCMSEEMRPIFNGDEKLPATRSSAADILNMFSSAPIENIAYFPNNICIACLHEIQQAYSFKLKCEKSEMFLHQLKRSNVDLTQLKEIPSLHEFENESNIKLSNIKEEPEEIMNDDFFTEDEVTQLKQKSPNLEFIKEEHSSDKQMDIKNEPELDIEDITWANSELLNCPACKKECKSLNLFLGHVAIDHMAEKLCKFCIEKFDNNQTEHSVKQIPNYLDKLARYKSSGCVENTSTADHNRHKQLQETKYTKLTDDNMKYQCNVCSKMFPSRGNQIRHMRRVHTDEKPFNCILCSEKFRFSSSLKIHMETKHPKAVREGKLNY